MGEDRICNITIVVKNRKEAAPRVNQLLGEYGEYVRARLGLPIKERGISVINVVLEADTDILGALSGKLGQIEGIQVKSITV